MEQQTEPRKRGPRPRYGEAVVPVTISITPSMRDYLAMIGEDGNVSDGVRKLVLKAIEAS